MREDFLHFVWKNKKFNTQDLQTVSGEALSILQLGQHNHLSGPDFFNAKIEIDHQLWAGNVEIHLKSSDWYAHHHEKDSNYDNVILHVVWEDDIEVFRKSGNPIPCLELKGLVIPDLVLRHRDLMKKKNFINCEKDFHIIDDFTMQNWEERLFVERLEQKSNLIFQLLKDYKNDWAKVLFCLLMKSFGLNTNGHVFLEIAKAIDFSIFRKIRHDSLRSESLLFGMANLLNKNSTDSYSKQLKKEFEFLASKFGLDHSLLPKPNFYGLRPNNFPTIRLSQVARLYEKNGNLFQALVEVQTIEDVKSVFDISASTYWDTHFVFGKVSSTRKKILSSSFMVLLIINTVLPIKFCYSKHKGESFSESLLDFAKALNPENNNIIKKFEALGAKIENAFQSQSRIQLYNEYCQRNHCLKCPVGNKLLLRNV